MWEKHWLVAFCIHPDWGSNSQPRYVPWLGIRQATFQFTGRQSNQLSHTGQALILHFILQFLLLLQLLLLKTSLNLVVWTTAILYCLWIVYIRHWEKGSVGTPYLHLWNLEPQLRRHEAWRWLDGWRLELFEGCLLTCLEVNAGCQLRPQLGVCDALGLSSNYLGFFSDGDRVARASILKAQAEVHGTCIDLTSEVK